MKKKELLKAIKILSRRVTKLEMSQTQCKYCENYKPKMVKFNQFLPFPQITHTQFTATPIFKDDPEPFKVTIKRISKEDGAENERKTGGESSRETH